MIEACLINDIETISILLEQGIDFNGTKKDNPLVIACENGYLEIVSLLLKKGANIEVKNHSGRTPLFLATSRGHKEIVLLLVDHVADVNATDLFGDTPLNKASSMGNKEIISLLLDRGIKKKVSSFSFYNLNQRSDSVIHNQAFFTLRILLGLRWILKK